MGNNGKSFLDKLLFTCWNSTTTRDIGWSELLNPVTKRFRQLGRSGRLLSFVLPARFGPTKLQDIRKAAYHTKDLFIQGEPHKWNPSSKCYILIKFQPIVFIFTQT